MNKLTPIRAVSITLIALLLGGCFGNQIKPEVKKQINTTEVQIIIKQPEIYAAIEKTAINSSPFGLLMAATDGDRKQMRIERANKAIKPVQKVMKGYKVNGMAKQIYNKSMKQVSWLKSSKVNLVSRDMNLDERYEMTRKSKADAVMFIEVDYRLTDSFKGVEVISKVDMYRENSKDPAAKPETVYRTNHTYKWDLPNNADGIYERDELGKKWSANRAAVLKEKIKEGLESEAQYLVKQMQKS